MYSHFSRFSRFSRSSGNPVRATIQYELNVMRYLNVKLNGKSGQNEVLQ